MIQKIILGQSPNDGTGEPLRDGGQKINDNFQELDTRLVEATNTANQASQTAANAQPKQAGKGLSTNDFTSTLKASLESLPEGKQDKNVNLTALAGLAGSANTFPYFTGAGALSLATITAKARALMSQTSATGMQTELGLVTITSLTDPTSGRVMTVGYMGLGGEVIVLGTSGAVNALRKTGFYYAAVTGDTPEIYGFVTHRSVGPNDGSQEFHGITTNNKYQRILSSGVWGAWSLSLSSMDTVRDPASGGIMSSTLVNGFYITKYANGDMKIQGSGPVTAILPANTWSNITVTIPAGFLVSSTTPVPYMSLVPYLSHDHYGVTSCYANTATEMVFFIRNGATAQQFGTWITVWGRWK